jgi:hypothetical protein
MNEERRAELDQLLLQSDSLIADFFRDAPEPDGDVEDLLDDSRLDAAARFDSSLTGLRNSQYIVRIRRDDGDDSRIDGPSVREVMNGIEAEVDAAAPRAREEARIELDSLTRGSVVLKYRAVRPFATVDEGQFDHGLSVVDDAISNVTSVHQAIENGAPPGEIVQIAVSKELLGASRKLIESLDRHNLNLTTRWRRATGERAASRLSILAKRNASQLFKRLPADRLLPISGQVIAIALDGRFVIKAPSRHYEIAASDLGVQYLQGGSIRLGEYLHLTLTEEIASDLLGLASKPTFRLVSLDERLLP